jgi:hypothetical protein
MKVINLQDQKINRWLVVSRGPNTTNGQAQWNCKCDCGNEKLLKAIVLNKRKSQSCGCLKLEQLIKRSTKHGYSPSKNRSDTYTIWAKIIQRCTNINDKAYPNYGERGITICDEWLNFVNFLQDMGERPSKQHSIDRIDNSKGYNKENCRWATSKEQGRNKRNNILLTFQNETLTVSEWCEKLNLPEKHIRARLKLGWSHEDTLSIPIGTNQDNVHCRKLTKDNITLTVAEWAKQLNIPAQRIYQRLHRGASDEQALEC